MGWLPWDFTFLLSEHVKDCIILPLLNKHAHNMQQPVLCIFLRYYTSSYLFKGVYIFSYLCLHVLWGRMCVREAPDPENSQGLVGDDSSETWTSWLSTCSPAQRTLLTACMVGKRTNKVKVRPLVLRIASPQVIFLSPWEWDCVTYIG